MMKTETICKIRDILKQRYEDAKLHYKEVQDYFEKKYNIDAVWDEAYLKKHGVSEKELTIFRVAYEQYHESKELLFEFENQDW